MGLKDLEDQVLFAQAACILDVEGLGVLDEVFSLGRLDLGELDVVGGGAFPFGGWGALLATTV